MPANNTKRPAQNQASNEGAAKKPKVQSSSNTLENTFVSTFKNMYKKLTGKDAERKPPALDFAGAASNAYSRNSGKPYYIKK